MVSSRALSSSFLSGVSLLPNSRTYNNFHSRIYIYIQQIKFIQLQRHILPLNTNIIHSTSTQTIFIQQKKLLYLKFSDIPNVYLKKCPSPPIFGERSTHQPSLLECVVKDRLTQIVRNEMALQWSGSASNASLLSRTTRNLISYATRSAIREAAGAARSSVEALFEAAVPTHQSGVFQTTGKRSASTSNHPWRFKKDKGKNLDREMPRSVPSFPYSKNPHTRTCGLRTPWVKFGKKKEHIYKNTFSLKIENCSYI